MSRPSRFFFKLCPNGHLIYVDDAPLAATNCQVCGEEFVETCGNCGTAIGNTFVARVSYLTKKPEPLPTRPDFCRNCGGPFPWTQQRHKTIEETGIWSLMHPKVVELGKPRFNSGHYADAVESVFKELNSRVKQLYFEATGDELDGVPLMRKAFTPSNPIIVLDDLGTETGKDIQQGYMELFAGSMAGIRNPKAHHNLHISAERATHHLMLASLLFFKLGERK